MLDRLFDKLPPSFQRQKKQVLAMAGLLAFGLLLWGRLILLDRVPRTAVATPDADAPAADVAPSPTARVAEPVFLGRIDHHNPRDLFAMDRSPYRPNPRADNRGDAGKTGNPPDDEDSRIAEARRAARALSLQSVVRGPRPRAVINDRILRLHDSIEGFELLQIGPDTAVVAQDGLAFRLAIPVAPRPRPDDPEEPRP